MAQAGDHAFPPLWGRLSAPSQIGCAGAYLATFDYPHWIPFDCMFGLCDFSQEFECSPPPVPVRNGSWGEIKGLYR